jgi:acyl-CoA synthetase (AMP-forming)/AMP-acid ligase II
VLTAAVYGVEVPGADGKAGMATVEVEPGGTLDLVGLADHLARTLAPYARPLFLRVTAQMDTTGTFKPRKVDLARDGYDHARVSDPLYLLHPQSRCYEPLDARLRDALEAGTVRL